MILSGKPPRTTQTPSAIRSARRRGPSTCSWVRALASSASRASRRRAGRRQQAELAGDVAAVDVGVVVGDQVVLIVSDVAALDLDPAAVGREALERARAGERARARQRTAARLRSVVTSRISNAKSGNAANSSPKYARIPSGAISSCCADQPIDTAGAPAGHRGVEVVRGQSARSSAWRSRTVRPSRRAVYAPRQARLNIVPAVTRAARARTRRAGPSRAVAAAAAAAVAGRPPLQRLGDRRRLGDRAGRHRDARGRTRWLSSSGRWIRSTCGSSTCGCWSAPTRTPITGARRRRSAIAPGASSGCTAGPSTPPRADGEREAIAGPAPRDRTPERRPGGCGQRVRGAGQGHALRGSRG